MAAQTGSEKAGLADDAFNEVAQQMKQAFPIIEGHTEHEAVFHVCKLRMC